jgi:hypothetical protein
MADSLNYAVLQNKILLRGSFNPRICKTERFTEDWQFSVMTTLWARLTFTDVWKDSKEEKRV